MIVLAGAATAVVLAVGSDFAFGDYLGEMTWLWNGVICGVVGGSLAFGAAELWDRRRSSR